MVESYPPFHPVSFSLPLALGKYVIHDMAMHVGETVLSALELEG